jgi:transcriptional regulator with XRE-family HTH domain
MTSRGLRLSDLKTADDVLAEHLEDPEFRKEWNRTALARAVGIRLLRYRAKMGMTQGELAKKIGLKQPAVARLEAAEKNPTWETLARLSEALSIEFVVDIAPRRRKTLVAKDLRKTAEVFETSDDGRIVVAIS